MNRHNAPPVTYPLGHSRFLGGLLFALWFSGFCAVLLWWHTAQQSGGQLALAVFSVLMSGLATRVSWNHLPSGHLRWDGAAWHWESPGYQTGVAEQAVAVIADFQHSLLLRLENQAGASLWLWVEKSTLSERWMDLRRAVYSAHRQPLALSLHATGAEAPLVSPCHAATPVRVAPAEPVLQEKP